MNISDFNYFLDDLKSAVRRLYDDKASSIETFVDCKDKEYRVFIEEVKKE